jgi:hypothetical protein
MTYGSTTTAADEPSPATLHVQPDPNLQMIDTINAHAAAQLSVAEVCTRARTRVHMPIMHAQILSTLRVYVESGLNSNEVCARRAHVGANECKIDEHEPLWKKYGEQVCMRA